MLRSGFSFRANAGLIRLFATALALSSCEINAGDNKSDLSEQVTAAVANCTAGPRPSSEVKLLPAFGGASFRHPIELAQARGETTRFYVVEQEGRIHRLTKGSRDTALFADITNLVNAQSNEGGLLGVALHPKFVTTGELYLSYTAPSASAPSGLRSVIVRAKSRDGGATLDRSSMEEILTLDQPYSNHNGGHIAFGPDGFLYIGFGDGGSGGDPLGNGQNTATLLGKILRIDVDRAAGYGIPTDNPFAGGGGRAEIYANGLRNPWRFSFDRSTGDLWCGDVGQNAIEEIDRIVKGGNYGWNRREGDRCFQPNCSSAGVIDPVATYSHAEGLSVTGGYVYRGSEMPSLVGEYVYGDFASGRIWALRAGGLPRVLFETSGTSPSSFAEDNSGELYLLDYASGQIKKFAPSIQSAGLPLQLSATGCLPRGDVNTRLVPYSVNAPLWSDGAEKERFFSLPAGGKISVNADGDWDLPNGSVGVKTFFIGGKRVETRLFMRHTDGTWAGYSYEWDDTETDARLLEGEKTKKIGNQVWQFPSRGQCMNCHQSAAGFTLGLETAQLNLEETSRAGGSENQVMRFKRLGLFANSFGTTARLSGYDDVNATTDERARAYLHANCSFCHRPGSVGRGVADYRFNIPFAKMRVCNTTPEQGSYGIRNAKLFAPREPERSMISRAMRTTSAPRMPPLASNIVDTIGSKLIDDWIVQTTACP